MLKYRVPHGSQPRPGWALDPRSIVLLLFLQKQNLVMVGIRSPDGLVVGLAPATLEFWVRFPLNERNTGLHDESYVPPPPHANSFLIDTAVINTHRYCSNKHTHCLGSSYLIAHVLHCPHPPPRTHLYIRSCSNKHTHISLLLPFSHNLPLVAHVLHYPPPPSRTAL